MIMGDILTEELLIDMERAAARELDERINKVYPLFHSLYEAQCTLTEKICHANESFECTNEIFDTFFMRIEEGDFSSANNDLKSIKKNALDSAAEMIRVATLAQKAIDSNAVKE